jgi:hypothetical protein
LSKRVIPSSSFFSSLVYQHTSFYTHIKENTKRITEEGEDIMFFLRIFGNIPLWKKMAKMG